MDYLKHKYTREYFLKETRDGVKTWFGAEGVEEFRRGSNREQDRRILSTVDFTGRTVLEVGPGRGEALKFALENGALRVVGIDFSEDAVAIAREFLAGYCLSAELHCMDALRFFEDATRVRSLQDIDVVLMMDVVEHIPRSDFGKLLDLVRHSLARKAIVVVNTPVYAVDNDVEKEGVNPKARDTSDECRETAGMHCNRYTKDSLRQYMLERGFVALSGHVFSAGLNVPQVLRGTRGAWYLAARAGYPLRLAGLWATEAYEYASTLGGNEGMGWGIRTRLGKIRDRLVAAARRRGSQPAATEWITVTGGPLEGRSLLLDSNSSASWQREMMWGTYDAFLFEALGGATTWNGKTVWDVGAHIGYHSLAFAALVGSSGRVVAFEPNRFNAERLESSLARNPDLAGIITVMSCALSNMDGSADFLISPEIADGRSSGSHLAEAQPPEGTEAYESFRQTRTAVSRADSLVRDGRVPIPSIVKIDVEGAEGLVLEGARELLRAHRPVMVVEVHHVQAMHDVVGILKEEGYGTTLVEGAPVSPSRAFLLAVPRSTLQQGPPV